MATFYTGGFGVAGPLMEWDGTNHEAIVEWVNEVATNEWAIISVSATELVMGDGGPYQTHIPLNGWVSRATIGPIGEPKSPGRWVTQDPLGRPMSLDSLLAPGSEPPPVD